MNPAIKKPRAVIIIPTYNERPNVAKLIPILAQVFRGITTWEMKVLIVDDSSPDETAKEVRALQKKYSFLELLVNPRKSGLGGAYLKGMAEAFGRLKADAVFEFDADLSHDPKKIPEFLVALDNGADLVLGSRYTSGGSIPANWGLERKFLSVFGNITIAVILTSTAVRDWTTGFRAIRRSVYEAVKDELGDTRFSGYTFQIGFLHKALRRHFRVKEVPFHFIDRTEGESKLGTEYIVNTFKYLLSARWKELASYRLFKLLVVGTIGFVVNFVFFRLFTFLQVGQWLHTLLVGAGGNGFLDKVLTNQGVAVVFSAELAIFSNYMWSNLWTFRDRRIVGFGKHISRFLQLNLSSVGAVVIQYVVMQLGVLILGVHELFRIVGFGFTTDNIYLVIGVLLGMIWNFTMYTKVIWRK